VRHKDSKLEDAIFALEKKLGRPPDEGEVARFLGISLEQYHKLLDETKGIPLISQEDLTPDYLEAHSAPEVMEAIDRGNPLDLFTGEETRHRLKAQIDRLPEKERLVISLYYFDEMTMKEIGRIIDLTESRVCQLHTQAILRLRGTLQDSDIEAGPLTSCRTPIPEKAPPDSRTGPFGDRITDSPNRRNGYGQSHRKKREHLQTSLAERIQQVQQHTRTCSTVLPGPVNPERRKLSTRPIRRTRTFGPWARRSARGGSGEETSRRESGNAAAPPSRKTRNSPAASTSKSRVLCLFRSPHPDRRPPRGRPLFSQWGRENLSPAGLDSGRTAGCLGAEPGS
jgi:RNA polymerase sigma factor (sigma-70 family)